MKKNLVRVLSLLLVFSVFGCGDDVAEGPLSVGGDAPTVEATSPASGATDVAINAKVTATFDVAMATTTINAETFTLKQGSTPVSGTVTYVGRKATFAPVSNLEKGTVYTATISSEALSTQGRPLAEDYTWQFTTGAAVQLTPPEVLSTTPTHGATGVALNARASATFSTRMDVSTINKSTFTLWRGDTQVDATVLYTAETATLAPTSPLQSNTEYTVMLEAGIKDLAGGELADDVFWSFTTLTVAGPTPPTVTSTSPANNATDVSTLTELTATFSTEMKVSTLNATTFTLRRGATNVTGTVTALGNTATFVPDEALLPNTQYIAMITTGAQNTANTALASNHGWSFTTGDAPAAPTVVSTDPADQATDVAVESAVNVTFSEGMDADSFTTDSFSVWADDVAIDGTVSYEDMVATFTPDEELEHATQYTVTLTTAVLAASGVALEADYIWTFTSAAAPHVPVVLSTDPADEAVDVAADTAISATFDVDMDSDTITFDTFTVTAGSTPLQGTLTYESMVATFTPDEMLDYETEYTVTITTGVQDAAGNPLAEDVVWTFTTAEEPPPVPEVVAMTPEDEATDVALNAVIEAVFMHGSLVTDLSFTLETLGTPVPGAVDFDDVTATFTPTLNLLPNTVYTATVSFSNEGAEVYVWTFTTGAL